MCFFSAQNDTLLFNPEIQEGSVLFNVETGKGPAMVDPNVVIKTTEYVQDKQVLAPLDDMGVCLNSVPINVIVPDGE